MSVALRDIGIYFIALTVFTVINLSFTFMPWNAFLVISIAVSLVALYAKYDLSHSSVLSGSRNSRTLEVEPAEAPEKINEKASRNEMWKKIDLDKSSKSSSKVHVDTQEVRINGEETNFMFGIIGRAKEPYNNQYISYIYDLTEDRIRKYDSQTYDAEERIQPFEGKYSWLTARGVEKQTLDEGSSQPGVVIEQNRSSNKGKDPE